MRLVLSISEGCVAPGRLESEDGTLWADGCGGLLFDLRSTGGEVIQVRSLRLVRFATRQILEGLELRIETESEGVRLNLVYVLAAAAPVLSEQFELVAPDPHRFSLHRAHFGWSLSHRSRLHWRPIPFGEGHETSAPVLLTDAARRQTLARDGVAICDEGKNQCLLVAKTPSDRDPEFVYVAVDGRRITFSGFHTEPSLNDCHQWLQDGRYVSSPTRFEVVSGAIERAFLAHRAFMDANGLGAPSDVVPPFNYCIYYECGDRWTAEQAEALIPVAASLGCTLLYTDQGWETGFGSGVWDEDRLGPCASFVEKTRAAGLDVGVLAALHASDEGAAAWPRECFRRSPQGTVEDGDAWHAYGICPQSAAWREEKTRRLARLAEAGVKFFSFDFNDCKAYAGPGFRHYPCHSREHEHADVQSSWEHVAAVARQQREFRAAAPTVLVEAHDWALAGDTALPGYLFPASAQERWGFEYMWNPFEDLRAGRLQNLAWFKLAYSRPLYLHMDLARDEPEQLTAFWFLASTVRHLGVGNFTALDADRQERVRAALRLYTAHREFFTHGKFFARAGRVHLHVLPGRGALVMLFNDSDTPRRVEGEFAACDLATVASVRPESWLGPTVIYTCGADRIHRFTAELPAWGVAAATLR